MCISRNIECIYRERETASSPASEQQQQHGAKRKREISSNVNLSTEPKSKNTSVLIRQPYFRWLGPTSVAPPVDGMFRLISVNLSTSPTINSSGGAIEQLASQSTDRPFIIGRHEFTRPPGADESLFSNSSTAPPTRSPSLSAHNHDHSITEQFYNGHLKPELPSKEAIDVFYSCLSSFLPFLKREELDLRIKDGVADECMLYAMAALAERMQPGSVAVAGITNSEDVSEFYAEQAKLLIIPLLAIPTVETVYTLLLIAYHEFADDRDSGLWAWSGLAIRMSYDLGLHKNPSGAVVGADQEQIDQRRRVLWSVFCLDRLVSCGTGRICTILLDQVEHQVGDITTGHEIVSAEGIRLNDPFPYLCRLLIILGKVSDALNSFTAGQSSSRAKPEVDMQTVLGDIRTEISEFHSSLPPDLVFDVSNFQAFAQTMHAQCLLLVHVWNHAIILALYHPELVYPRSAVDMTGWQSNPNANLTRTSAISIADMIAFSELISPEALLSNPFVSQPILMAGSTCLTLWRSLTSESDNSEPSSSEVAASTLHRGFTTCQDGLRRLQKRWKGVSWLCSMLDSLEKFEPDVDLSRASGSKVKMRDMGFVKRASIDEATRTWLAEEFDKEGVNMGVAIAGMTTESAGRFYEKSTESASSGNVTRGTGDERLTSDELGMAATGEPIIEHDLYQDEPRIEDINSSWGADDPLRSLLMGNISLDEFLSQ